jgi:hypothetical protein
LAEGLVEKGGEEIRAMITSRWVLLHGGNRGVRFKHEALVALPFFALNSSPHGKNIIIISSTDFSVNSWCPYHS